MVKWNIVVSTSCTSLTTANQSLDSQNVSCVEVALLLVSEEVLNLLIFVRDNAVLRISEDLVEAIDEVHESCNFLVANSDVTRSLVCNMYIMILLNQATDGTAHRDNVVVWVWREYDNLLREWISTLRTICVVSIRLTTRPSCDSVLQVVENLYVSIVC